MIVILNRNTRINYIDKMKINKINKKIKIDNYYCILHNVIIIEIYKIINEILKDKDIFYKKYINSSNDTISVRLQIKDIDHILKDKDFCIKDFFKTHHDKTVNNCVNILSKFLCIRKKYIKVVTDILNSTIYVNIKI